MRKQLGILWLVLAFGLGLFSLWHTSFAGPLRTILDKLNFLINHESLFEQIESYE